jgi:hypothetical protein
VQFLWPNDGAERRGPKRLDQTKSARWAVFPRETWDGFIQRVPAGLVKNNRQHS